MSVLKDYKLALSSWGSGHLILDSVKATLRMKLEGLYETWVSHLYIGPEIALRDRIPTTSSLQMVSLEDRSKGKTYLQRCQPTSSMILSR